MPRWRGQRALRALLPIPADACHRRMPRKPRSMSREAARGPGCLGGARADILKVYPSLLSLAPLHRSLDPGWSRGGATTGLAVSGGSRARGRAARPARCGPVRHRHRMDCAGHVITNYHVSGTNQVGARRLRRIRERARRRRCADVRRRACSSTTCARRYDQSRSIRRPASGTGDVCHREPLRTRADADVGHHQRAAPTPADRRFS